MLWINKSQNQVKQMAMPAILIRKYVFQFIINHKRSHSPKNIFYPVRTSTKSILAAARRDTTVRHKLSCEVNSKSRKAQLHRKCLKQTYRYEMSVSPRSSAILVDRARISRRFRDLEPLAPRGPVCRLCKSKKRSSGSAAPQNTGSDGSGKHGATSDWIVLDSPMPRCAGPEPEAVELFIERSPVEGNA